MSSKKRELEIVYNLEWKNKPANGDEKSNMVGILDIPATTLDWKTFKSYLLKNSGAADENVKVSYIDSEDREKAINSQLDFEIALYTFRHKARMSEIITLKLDCINSKKSIGGVKSITKGLSEVQVKTKPKVKKTEEPPEWFLSYMKKFKEELVDEISSIYSSKAHQMNMYHARKLKADSYKRARKTPLLLGEAMNDKELSKSAKIERKLESKLEKLEHKTLKIKAKKLALRGSSDSDVGRSSSKNETASYLTQNTVDINNTSMNASVIKKEAVPHLSGGESYCQTWEICNSGTLPWTSDTELRYAWGSQVLKPINKAVPCPPLKPGDSGTIAVFLEIPKIPGLYECYWHFYHKGRRFGHWLGCEIIVDQAPVKNISYVQNPTYDVINIQDVYELVLPTTWTSSKKTEEIDETPPQDIINPFVEEEDPQKFATCFPCLLENNQNFNENKEEETKDLVDGPKDFHQEAKADANAFSDTDNQSIISLSDSNSSVNSGTSEDFVVLKMAKEPKSEKKLLSPDVVGDNNNPNLTKMNVSSLENIDHLDKIFTNLSMENSFLDCMNPNDLKLDHAYLLKTDVDDYVTVDGNKEIEITDTTTSNIIQQKPIDLSSKSTQEDDENDTGYAYVHYQGRKIPISKKHLSAEYLTTAESVPECEIKNLSRFKIDDVVQREGTPTRDATEPVRHTSTPSIDGSNVSTQQQQLQQDMRGNEGNPFCSLLDTSIPRNECSSTCGLSNSMMSSSNENRFFVFPQFYPGYEVVPPIGTSYMDPNPLSYQPLYRYNNIGEGLNYSSCTIYPNSVTQCCNSIPETTPNTSRGCSSIPNSNGGTPSNHSPQSPENACPCKKETLMISSCNGHCKIERNANTNASFEESQCRVRTDSANNVSSFENLTSSAPTQPKARVESRGSSRVGVPDILSGATVVATSAMNTARSVLNMFVPPRSTDCGRWQNGHWITTNPESQREKNLRLLYEMGFYNRDLNATLLARYNDDINAVISELLQ